MYFYTMSPWWEMCSVLLGHFHQPVASESQLGDSDLRQGMGGRPGPPEDRRGYNVGGWDHQRSRFYRKDKVNLHRRSHRDRTQISSIIQALQQADQLSQPPPDFVPRHHSSSKYLTGLGQDVLKSRRQVGTQRFRFLCHKLGIQVTFPRLNQATGPETLTQWFFTVLAR